MNNRLLTRFERLENWVCSMICDSLWLSVSNWSSLVYVDCELASWLLILQKILKNRLYIDLKYITTKIKIAVLVFLYPSIFKYDFECIDTIFTNDQRFAITFYLMNCGELLTYMPIAITFKLGYKQMDVKCVCILFAQLNERYFF